MRERLRGARADVARSVSAAIATHLAAIPGFAAAQGIGLFAAIPGEPDLRALSDDLRAAGRRTAYPRCRDDGGMDFVVVAGWEDLESGRYGVLEPGSHIPAALPATIDFVLVPGLAFDRAGARLGRGRGYYDRALVEAVSPAAVRVGVALAEQLVPDVPTESHDVRMDWLVTEEGVMRIEPASAIDP